jgi:hypothetical protein
MDNYGISMVLRYRNMDVQDRFACRWKSPKSKWAITLLDGHQMAGANYHERI